MAEEIKQASSGTEGAQNQAPKDQDVENNKVIAALSYFWVLFLIPLLLKRDSKFAQFHAKQGLVLFIVDVIATIIMWIPVIGTLIGLALFVVSIIGILKTLNGEWWKVPYIYDWSQKINL